MFRVCSGGVKVTVFRVCPEYVQGNYAPGNDVQLCPRCVYYQVMFRVCSG